jgi:hypothetical protein
MEFVIFLFSEDHFFASRTISSWLGGACEQLANANDSEWLIRIRQIYHRSGNPSTGIHCVQVSERAREEKKKKWGK